MRDLGFVRADGVTPIGQPHLEPDRRWTLEDIRTNNITIRSPNIRVARELGLPTGDHSDCVPGDGSVPIELAVADLATGAPVAMKVRFEPIGEEIECAPDETVLDAAFRQG